MIMRHSITTSMTLSNALAPAMRVDARVWLMTTTTSMTITVSYIKERLA